MTSRLPILLWIKPAFFFAGCSDAFAQDKTQRT